MKTETLLFLAMAEGALTGSFVSLVAARLPALLKKSQGKPAQLSHLVIGISWPRSHCQSCKATVRLRDLIPIVAYISLRGRCRDCGFAFGSQELLMEVCGAGAGLISFALFGDSLETVLSFTLLSLILGFCAFAQKGTGWNECADSDS